MQIPGKLMNQTWKNDKKNLIYVSILVYLGQIWAPKCFFAGFTSTSS